jgi:hypothetical protein
MALPGVDPGALTTVMAIRNATVGLALVVAVAAGLASAIGAIVRGDGSVETVTSVRGETYSMVTTGVYAYNAQRVVAEGVGWDVFTLLVAVPAMVIAALLVARGSYRARFVVGGLFGYFLYQYLEYAVTWAFGPLFLLFVVIFAMSLLGIALVGVDLGRDGLAGRFEPGLPRRAWPALLVAMSILLTMMWLQRIVTGLTVGVDGLLFGGTTMTVPALDLGLVVPISLAVAILSWRGSDMAHAISAAYVVMFVAMTAAIASMLVSAALIEGVVEVAPIAIFGLAGVVALWLARRMYRCIGPADVRFRAEATGLIRTEPVTRT